MIITKHGKIEPIFKGVAKHGGQKLVWFGWSPGHLKCKEQKWLLENMPVTSAKEKKRPKLRVIAGGRKA